ncbi:hypothetical protein GPM19_15010 [Halomonas sp. ZH2S]|uniref:CARDB domain-containing protein n=1 Tax=Vreelandella zhuhanensis TaxID=2684210 RepID=A0A7X3KRE8_9GAMM|nr:hypothetical protein [Halomonas zhuhanensis]MWJ29489.1 hypothetical protein [Halomonas zhuhanensis]
MTSQKGVIIATIIAALITAGVTLYVYFDGKEDGLLVTETVNHENPKENDEKQHVPTPRITFSEVFITPVDTNIPSSFFAEITNTGSKSANEFLVSVDFGEATPESCEVVSAGSAVIDSGGSSVIKRWEVSELAIKQSLYVVCNLNAPFFKALSVGEGNLENDAQLTFSSYKEQREEESITFLEGVLRFWLVAFSGILLFYFFLRLMKSLG